MTRIAAVTMVRDDIFFLRHWLDHYGTALGRENCYVVNHGHGAEVAALAQGCNLVGIPGFAHRNFDMKRWRLLNNLVMGLRAYYDHVIVGDVDELVVVDPAAGAGLAEYLGAFGANRVLTPLARRDSPAGHRARAGGVTRHRSPPLGAVRAGLFQALRGVRRDQDCARRAFHAVRQA